MSINTDPIAVPPIQEVPNHPFRIWEMGISAHEIYPIFSDLLVSSIRNIALNGETPILVVPIDQGLLPLKLLRYKAKTGQLRDPSHKQLIANATSTAAFSIFSPELGLQTINVDGWRIKPAQEQLQGTHPVVLKSSSATLAQEVWTMENAGISGLTIIACGSSDETKQTANTLGMNLSAVFTMPSISHEHNFIGNGMSREDYTFVEQFFAQASDKDKALLERTARADDLIALFGLDRDKSQLRNFVSLQEKLSGKYFYGTIQPLQMIDYLRFLKLRRVTEHVDPKANDLFILEMYINLFKFKPRTSMINLIRDQLSHLI